MRACSNVWLYERSLKVLRGRDGVNDFRQPWENFDEEHHTPDHGRETFLSFPTGLGVPVQKRSACGRVLSSHPIE